VVLDNAGLWVNREQYLPYGETSFGSFARKRYRFTGKERDDESGLRYHAARYYAPWLARWMSTDPAAKKDALSLYIYVSDNPVKFHDPSGKSQEPVHGALTYHLALAAGFREQDAAILGLAAAAVDHDVRTQPVNGVWGTITNIVAGVTEHYHFANFRVAQLRVEG
jgi:RHS repeat-associated protein